MGGLSRRSVKINEIRKSGIDPLILDAGDLFFSTNKITRNNKESQLFRAGAIVEGYNRIGCDAINVGHYEMLNGLPFLKKMSEKTDIPFLSANLKDPVSKKLLFDPYRIIQKGSLKIGVVGVTDKLPDTCKSMFADDFIESGKHYIDEVSKMSDIVVILVNSDRSKQSELPNQFEDADFIVSSGSNNMSRPNSPQKEDGPYFYSCGKQGKYLLVLNLDINDSSIPLVDVSSHEKRLESIKKRFDRLQKKNPEKSLEEIYAKQDNILKLISQYQAEIVESETAIKSAVNSLEYKTVALNKNVGEDSELLSFVDESLLTCSLLKPEVPTKPAIVNKRINSKTKKPKHNSHTGHRH